MEKEQSSSNYGLVLENGYLHPNYWASPNNQNHEQLYESTLTSVVSSPSMTPTTLSSSSPNGCGGVMMNELIGRLGSIVDSSGEIHNLNNNNNNGRRRSSTNTSCYTTPLDSPPLSSSKYDFSSLMNSVNNGNSLGCLNDDFVERAAKFSCFGISNNNFNHNINNDISVNRSISRINSEKKMNNNNNNNDYKNGENNGESRESSSVSEQKYQGAEMTCKLQNDGNSRKRKSIPKAKLKVENEESDAKRSKLNTELNQKKNADDCNSSKVNENNNNNNNNNSNNNSNNNKSTKNNNGKNDDKNNKESKAEPPKDYIHVRARRGQATDSHSLAERVRREKISERMKFLQDLVPGCNKVTGKATVLDEIINYVQSLQRQVEFLSMKLSTVNPRAEFNMDALISKEMFETREQLSQAMYQLDQNSAQEFPFVYQSTQQMPISFPNGLENPFSLSPMNVADFRRNPNGPTPSTNGFADSLAQLPTLWEDDLQSIVQMGIVPNQTQSVPGTLLPNAHMKVEL